MRWLFALVALVAALAGTASWLAMRPPAEPTVTADVSTGALMAAAFRDLDGRARSLAQYQGKVLVLNFWATWCGPCREEMPSFQRLQARWADRGVQFVGVSAEDAAKVAPFARSLGVTYPLWVGGDEVLELSRRLGNTRGVLPHTVLIDRAGRLAGTRVGAYPETALHDRLEELTANPQRTAAN